MALDPDSIYNNFLLLCESTFKSSLQDNFDLAWFFSRQPSRFSLLCPLSACCSLALLFPVSPCLGGNLSFANTNWLVMYSAPQPCASIKRFCGRPGRVCSLPQSLLTPLLLEYTNIASATPSGLFRVSWGSRFSVLNRNYRSNLHILRNSSIEI